MAHIHEKIDFTVSVFIVHENKVLLRKHEKYDIWLGVGGHIELDEDPNEAAVREVKEEVGLDIVLWNGNQQYTEMAGQHKELIPPVSLNRHHISPAHEHIDMLYFAGAASNTVIPEHADDEWKWLTMSELDSADLIPDVRFYAKLALDTLEEK